MAPSAGPGLGAIAPPRDNTCMLCKSALYLAAPLLATLVMTLPAPRARAQAFLPPTPLEMAPRDDVHRWKGRVQLPTGESIEIYLIFTGTDRRGWTGRIEVPLDAWFIDAGAVGYGPTQMNLTFLPPNEDELGRVSLTCTPNESMTQAEGVYLQFSEEYKVFLDRIPEPAAPAGPKRPQTPAPPFPYTVREVALLGDGGTRLGGTLTIPSGPGPHPALAIVSDAGARDRDGLLYQHRPHAVIADALARAGVGVLRLDDRGVDGSKGDALSATPAQRAGDIARAVDLLKLQPELDSARLGLLGHGEGAVVAALAAAQKPELAFVAMLSPQGLPQRELLPLHARAAARALGADDARQDRALKASQRLISLVGTKIAPAALREAAVDAATAQWDQALAPNAIDAAVEPMIARLGSPAALAWLDLDPRPAYVALRGRVAAFFPQHALDSAERAGEKAVRAALEQRAAGADVHDVPGVNHFGQPTSSPSPADVLASETTLEPKLLDQLAAWITQRPNPDAPQNAPASEPASPAR